MNPKYVTKSKHGMCNTRLYGSWTAMIARCYYKKDPQYFRYGGRGVTVCDEWRSFVNFKVWATVSGYREGLTIDRIDPQGDYTPYNCRWLTRAENTSRATTRRYITAYGETKTAREWLKDKKCKASNYKALLARLRYGWTPEKAISEPARPYLKGGVACG